MSERSYVFVGWLAIVGGLIGAALYQPFLSAQRMKIVPERLELSRDLAARFPMLVLGGFRGPLVMALWQKAEEEKNAHRWEEVTTLHHMVGRLQPHFASVYIYNCWNLAYNMSAQWNSMEKKFQWVQAGLDYAKLGLKYMPD